MTTEDFDIGDLVSEEFHSDSADFLEKAFFEYLRARDDHGTKFDYDNSFLEISVGKRFVGFETLNFGSLDELTDFAIAMVDFANKARRQKMMLDRKLPKDWNPEKTW